ncbi:MAG: hypothetical protein LUQ38_01025 [Methanotrichaceae archaeon]|nr:hypothetical protein [Methanotrichaceae archaeon]
MATMLDLPTWIRDRWLVVAYLYPAPIDWLKDAIEKAPTEIFSDKVNRYVKAYIEKGVMPPEAIAVPIMNMADDIMGGNRPTLRTGDYIALQNFFKQAKK